MAENFNLYHIDSRDRAVIRKCKLPSFVGKQPDSFTVRENAITPAQIRESAHSLSKYSQFGSGMVIWNRMNLMQNRSQSLEQHTKQVFFSQILAHRLHSFLSQIRIYMLGGS
jgi:hypothetical protein